MDHRVLDIARDSGPDTPPSPIEFPEDGRAFTATGISRNEAEFPAVALAHPSDDVVAAHRDPRGGPDLRLPR